MNKKTSNKKIYVIFTLIMLACSAAGFGIGFTTMKLVKTGSKLFELNKVDMLAKIYSPLTFILGAFVLVCALVSLFTLNNVKKRALQVEKLEDEEYENEIVKVQDMLSLPLIIENVLTYMSFIPISVQCVAIITMVRNDREINVGFMVASCVIFTLNLIVYMYVNNTGVKEIQKINPNLKGNVFDCKFQKNMLASMDEGQLYEKAMQSMNAVNVGSRVALILVIVAFLGAITFDTGIFTIVCLIIVIVSMYLAGCTKAKK